MRNSKLSVAGFFFALLAAISSWYFVDRIIVGHQVSDAAVRGLPRGNLSDLYPRWLGTRELLLHGRDPYSPEVTREIQEGYYGRPLDPNRKSDPKDQQGFAYPLYVVLLLAPTVHSPFSIVQAVFRWLLIALACLSLPLWARAAGVKLRPVLLLICTILLLGSFPAIQGIKLQQLTVLVCTLLAGAAAALVNGNLILAGILLALATIKPQLVGLSLGWLALWISDDWRLRKPLAWSFSATMFVLLGASEWLQPGWINHFYGAVGAYWNYTGGGYSWLDVALTPTAGKPVAAMAVLLLAFFCWRVRGCRADTPEFRWSIALVFATTLIVIPSYALYNQLLLLPAVILIANWAHARRHRRPTTLLVTITAAAMFWPWVAAGFLDLLSFLLPAATVQKTWAVPLWTTMAIPFAVLACVLACMRDLALGFARSKPRLAPQSSVQLS